MKRLILVLFLALTPLMASAQESMRDQIISELREDGYSDIRIFRTFLGRLRFIARDETTRREIVLNPATGVILRDYLRFIDSDEGGSSSGSAGSRLSGAGSDDGDDDDDDDDDNDDDGNDDDGGDDGGGSDDDDD